MKPLRVARLAHHDDASVELTLEHGWRARITLPAGGYGRLTFTPPGGYREPRTWAIAHGRDVPWEGRSRDDATGVESAKIALVDRAGVLELRGGEVAAHVRLEPFGVSWRMRAGDRLVDAAIDRPTYAYAVSTSGTRIVHSVTRDAHDRY